MEAWCTIFGYLKHEPKRKIAFDPDHPSINERRFKKYDWTDFYRDAQEPIPPNAPSPRGKEVSTHCFVDANLAGNTVTRRSQMGILLFVNKAPIIWLSKRTNTVESSTFGSEIVAMRSAVDMIESLRYKLRMFGIPIEGPTKVFCDNQAVTKKYKKNWKSIIYLKVPPSPLLHPTGKSGQERRSTLAESRTESEFPRVTDAPRNGSKCVIWNMIVGTRSALILLGRARGVKEISYPGSSQPDRGSVAATLSDKRFGEF